MKRIGTICVLATMAAALAGCWPEPNPGEDLHGAWAYAQMFVEKRLASPGSARFQPGAVADGYVRHVGGDIYEVSAWVDAQNVFGGAVRTPFRYHFRRLDNGTRWLLEGEVQWR